MINLIVKTFEGIVKIPFGNDLKTATLFAKSFGIEHGEPVARIERT